MIIWSTWWNDDAVEKSMKAAKELVSGESESHASKVWNWNFAKKKDDNSEDYDYDEDTSFKY